MSTPRSLVLPPRVRRVGVSTPRGALAALLAEPPLDGGQAPVILVPGYTGSKEDFLALLDPLSAAGHRVLALDQRGQFESDGDDDPSSYDVKQLADDLLAVAAGLGGAVHLVGHSFGGLVVRAAALADPTAVRSITLIGSGPAAIPHPASSNLALLVNALPTTDSQTVWRIKRQLELGGRPGPPPEIEAFLERRFLANNRTALLRMAEQLLSEPDSVAEVAGLGLPTLVLFGSGDHAWPPAAQRDMAARLGAVVTEISGAAHSPAVENPDATADALLRFWQASAATEAQASGDGG